MLVRQKIIDEVLFEVSNPPTCVACDCNNLRNFPVRKLYLDDNDVLVYTSLEECVSDSHLSGSLRTYVCERVCCSNRKTYT